mmetsp:Transcript_22540/g.64918  ORF Transcript_22540/g.64918 Transcript_22540/m.64918 type:complete len:208 (+) Transcript_22540:735-1358(+)
MRRRIRAAPSEHVHPRRQHLDAPGAAGGEVADDRANGDVPDGAPPVHAASDDPLAPGEDPGELDWPAVRQYPQGLAGCHVPHHGCGVAAPRERAPPAREEADAGDGRRVTAQRLPHSVRPPHGDREVASAERNQHWEPCEVQHVADDVTMQLGPAPQCFRAALVANGALPPTYTIGRAHCHMAAMGPFEGAALRDPLGLVQHPRRGA